MTVSKKCSGVAVCALLAAVAWTGSAVAADNVTVLPGATGDKTISTGQDFVAVGDGGTLNLTATNGTAAAPLDVKVINAGLGTVNLTGTGVIKAAAADVKSLSLSGTSELQVIGTTAAPATATISNLSLNGGSLFVDPAHVLIKEVNGVMGGDIYVGAASELNIGSFNSGKWASTTYAPIIGNVTASLALKQTIQFAPAIAGGGNQIVVDGTLVAGTKVVTDRLNSGLASPTPAVATEDIFFGANSALIVDVTNSTNPAFDLTLVRTTNAIGAAAGEASFNKNTAFAVYGAELGSTYTLVRGASAGTIATDGIQFNGAGNVVTNRTDTGIQEVAVGTVNHTGNIFVGQLLNGSLFVREGAGLSDGSGTLTTNNDDLIIKIRAKDAAGIQTAMPLLNHGSATMLANAMADANWAAGMKADGTADGRFVHAAQMTPNARTATLTIEGAAAIAAAGGVQGTAYGLTSAQANAFANRASGVNGGNVMQAGAIGIWANPVFVHNSVEKAKSGNFKTGYNSNVAGLAIGADYSINEQFRVGLSVMGGGGSAESKGNYAHTKNDINFWGLSLYGSAHFNQIQLTADMGYAQTSNDLKQSSNVGQLKSKPKADVFNLGLRAAYNYTFDNGVNVKPYIGLRFANINTKGHNVSSAHGTVFNVKKDSQNVFTFPIGVNVSTDLALGAWTVTPQVDLAIVPAAGDIRSQTQARLGSINTVGNTSFKTDVVDRVSFDAGLGVKFTRDNVSLGLNYNLETGKIRTSHGVNASLRVTF